MKRTLYSLALVLALTLAAVPSRADHVSEPTLPITSLRTLVYDYPAIQNPLVCDGTDKVTFSTLRVEPLIAPLQDGNGGASEHWTLRMSVLPGDMRNGAFRPRLLLGGADTLYHHQNTPPHHPFAEDEANQWNTYMHRVGWWQVSVTVTGEESGQVFSTVCTFEKVG